jgi:U3 small nucleolar RNA-associated protein 23
MLRWSRIRVGSRWILRRLCKERSTDPSSQVRSCSRRATDLASNAPFGQLLTNNSVITQCEIRKLYAQKSEPGVSEAIEVAKGLERRRCGHHPDDHPEPLDTLQCMAEVVDPNATGHNKHRYVVASQSLDVRSMLRSVRGVPLIYIRRSVMILEPMADESAQMRQREERGKFRAELKRSLWKRKREEQEDDKADDENRKTAESGEGSTEMQSPEKKKKKKKFGTKGPNPLSIKKAKKAVTGPVKQKKDWHAAESTSEAAGKRKRRRKGKASGDGTTQEGMAATAPSVVTADGE